MKNILTKKCSKCKQELSFENFYPDKSKKSGYRSHCKKCTVEYNISEKSKDCQKKYQKTQKGKDCRNGYRKTKKSIDYNNQYIKDRRKTDPNFKLILLLRMRLNKALKNNQKTGSAVRDLGCTVTELKFYLEGKFKDGMTWNNHGNNGWHIDHEIPLSLFDLTNREQFLQAVHYTNLQPMWAKENISKGNRLVLTSTPKKLSTPNKV